ncbi:MAG: pantetheine-phosphate adenylyltransferase [Candidatus Xenobia bacterium]
MASKLRRGVYAGSFDPLTNGHVDIIDRAFHLVDEVIVAVVRNPSKSGLFTLEERKEIIEQSLAGRTGITVTTFSGLLVNYVTSVGADLIVRGLRALSDFEFEYQMALMNRKLNPSVETVFMMTQDRYAFLSSSTVREVAALGGSIAGLVPEYVEQRIYEKFREDRERAVPLRGQKVDTDS